MTDTIRCNNCGSYWQVAGVGDGVAAPGLWIIRCPNGHYSSYTLERDIITDSPLIELKDLHYIPKCITKGNVLLQLELDWIARQTAEFYDAGFFSQFMGVKSPIPPLDLGRIAKPTESGRLQDELGNEYRLAISPNGVAYYIREVKSK